MNDDLDLIERLRSAGASGPTSRHTPDAVLTAGRKAQSRRNLLRGGGAALGVAAVVAMGMQLTPSGTQTVTAAGDGAPGDSPAPAVKPAPQKVTELSGDSDRINAKILQAAMGDDFDVDADYPQGHVVAGSKAAAGLPSDYAGVVSLSTMVSNAAGLKQMCAPLVEKGTTFDGCVTRTLADGTEVQVNFSRWAPTAAYPQDTAGEAVRVFFLQPNGVLAWTDLVASTLADKSEKGSGAVAQKWLSSMVDRLGAAAANPAVEAEGFDGDHCDQTGDTWNCDPGHAKPAPESEPVDEKALEAKKMAAEKQAIADKEAAAKQSPSEDMPADKAAAIKKAEAEKMAAAEKQALAEKCAAAGKC